jgi:hypothetical protein
VSTAYLRNAIAAILLLLAAACGSDSTSSTWLGEPEVVSPGVDLYRNNDESLVDGAGPIAVFLMKIDPARARLASVLANDRVLDSEAVVDIARRHHAVGAVNGGFFNRDNGEPLGLLKVDGRLVSDNSAARGAVIVTSPPGGPTSLTFDRLAAKMSMSFASPDGEPFVIPIDGVDTTRQRGRLMLYTPRYHTDTDTAPTGTEWVLDGQPLRVVSMRARAGRTPIPAAGVVLSFGGLDLPTPLKALLPGVVVSLSTRWRSSFGVPDDVLDASHHIINGAGLLRREGRTLDEWAGEALSDTAFVNARHPRTLVGRDAEGAIWLVAIDGRQPDYSIGMTFADLQRLGDRLQLVDALNLDGGGSTTMVVRDQVVNRPSDPGGARPVSDAIIVTPR